jgi:REP element-mobilizing transposase RayT
MGVSHQKRPDLGGVVHVTQKLCTGLPGMRTKAAFRVLVRAVREGKERGEFRVCAFSVLSNHLHFLVEAGDNEALSRGIQGLATRVAKALNKHWGRHGKVFRERFFATALRTMTAMRRGLVYVLQNARKHGVRVAAGEPDPYSSGPWFRFWRGRRGEVREDAAPVALPRHPTLDVILMRRIGVDEVPGGIGLVP